MTDCSDGAWSCLVPRTARTIDVAVGERHGGPILLRDGQRSIDEPLTAG